MDENYRPVVIFETTKECNYRCVMCSWSNKDAAKSYAASKDPMTLDLFARVLPTVSPFASAVSLSCSGEFLKDPLLSARFKPMGDFLRKHKSIKFAQVTNAALLDEQNLEFLRGVHEVSITISIDTTDFIEYSYIRRPGYFHVVEENACKLRERLTAIGVKKIIITLGVVLMKSNIFSLPNVVKLANKLGSGIFCDHVQNAGVVGMQKQSLFLYPALSNFVLKKSIALAKTLNVTIDHPPLFLLEQPTDKTACNEKHERPTNCKQLDLNGPLIIQPNGDLRPCCGTGLIVGNVLKNSIEEIMSGEKVAHLKQAISKGTPLPPCNTCRFLQRESKYLFNSADYGWDIPFETRSNQLAIDVKKDGFFDWVDDLPEKYLKNQIKRQFNHRALNIIGDMLEPPAPPDLSTCADINNFLFDLISSKQEVVIYGAGEGAKWIFQYTLISKCNIAAVLDKDLDKQGSVIFGHVVKSPELIKINKPDLVLIATSRQTTNIVNFIKSMSDRTKVKQLFN